MIEGLSRSFNRSPRARRALSATLRPIPVSPRALANDATIVRLVGALLLEQNDEWQLQRRYMQLEGLSTVSENQTHRISAVVTR